MYSVYFVTVSDSWGRGLVLLLARGLVRIKKKRPNTQIVEGKIATALLCTDKEALVQYRNGSYIGQPACYLMKPSPHPTCNHEVGTT